MGKYVGINALNNLIANIKTNFTPSNHEHTKSEITDFPDIPKIEVITQTEYDALTSPDSSTLYIIEV